MPDAIRAFDFAERCQTSLPSDVLFCWHISDQTVVQRRIWRTITRMLPLMPRDAARSDGDHSASASIRRVRGAKRIIMLDACVLGAARACIR